MPDETIEYETTEDPTLKAILKHSDHNDFYASLLRYYEGRGYLTLPQAECLKKDSCFQCNPPRRSLEWDEDGEGNGYDIDDYGSWNGSFDRY